MKNIYSSIKNLNQNQKKYIIAIVFVSLALTLFITSRKDKNHQPQNQNPECVLAVDISKCCNCPFVTTKKNVDKYDNYILYQEQDYEQLPPEKCDCTQCYAQPKEIIFNLETQKCQVKNFANGQRKVELQLTDKVEQHPIIFEKTKESYITVDMRYQLPIILESNYKVNCSKVVAVGQLKNINIDSYKNVTFKDYQGMHMYAEQKDIHCLAE